MFRGELVVLRMVFDRQDLLRVRLASAADPMWEMVFSLRKTGTPKVPAPLVGWRQKFDRRLACAGKGADAVALLQHLVRPEGNFPDFLTPSGPVTDIDVGCEAVLCTPRRLLRADLSAVFAKRVAPTWVRSLGDGDSVLMGEVTRAVRDSYELLIAPHWAEVREVVAADLAVRTRQLTEDGVGALLGNLPGVLGWDGRVLRTRYPVDRTVHLGGRGLVLVPSYFSWGNPVTWINQELPPMLVYQALGHRARAEVSVSERLVSLLGGTRAECLRILHAPRTTTELAEHLGASIGTASKQAAILRETGLITSDRRGPAVLHNITALGVALLVGHATDR
jgi:DNA-binding transcriptional ArsR family regulator